MRLKASEIEKETKDVKVYDAYGRLLKGVIEFDTETCEAKVCLLGAFEQETGKGPYPVIVNSADGKERSLLIVDVKLLGAFATINGERV